MRKFLSRMNPMFVNLFIGTILSGLVIGVLLGTLLAIFFPQILVAGLVGYACGLFYAILQLAHMYYGILVTLDYREEKSATWHSRKMYAIRLVAALVIFFVAWYVGDAYGLAFSIPGMMSLKVAAYLQPITDKLIHAVLKDETANKK